MMVVRAVGRRHVNLLVHQLELLGLSLRNIQSDTQVVVVLDQLFDSSATVGQVMRQHFTLTGQFLNDLCDFNSVECCLT